jgi:hypothetical protein
MERRKNELDWPIDNSLNRHTPRLMKTVKRENTKRRIILRSLEILLTSIEGKINAGFRALG